VSTPRGDRSSSSATDTSPESGEPLKWTTPALLPGVSLVILGFDIFIIWALGTELANQ
jgi:hypothetical protein